MGAQKEEEEAMKVIPYRDVLGRDISSPITSGGIERFIRHLRDELDDSCIVDVSKMYYDAPLAMADLVAEESKRASHVICNYPNRYLNVNLPVTCPVVWVNHHTAGLHPEAPDIVRRMNEHVRIRGDQLWMVSRKQARDWVAYARLLGIELEYHGIISPSMVKEAHPHSNTVRWEIATIGRCDDVKNPFLAHEVAREAKMSSLVLCSFMANDYAIRNQDWYGLQETGWDLTDAQVAADLSHCGVFLVTWPDETFGIAALEALSHGLPLVLYSPKGDHACEELIPNSHWIRKAKKVEDIVPAVREMLEITPNERALLGAKARALHGINAWRDRLREMME